MVPGAGTPPIEIQSAFMAAAAASVLAVAVLRERRDRGAGALAILGLAFATWAVGRGAAAVGPAAGTYAADAGLLALGVMLPVYARRLAGRPLSARLVVALLAAAVGLGAWQAIAGPEAIVPARSALAFAAAGALVGVAALLQGTRARWRDPAPAQVRLRYLLAAHGAVAVAIGIDLGAHLLARPRIATLFAGLLYLYVAYLHQARVRVADLRQLMGSAIALALLALGLAVSISALWLWVGPQPGLFLFNAFVGSFLLLIFLQPLRAVIQRLLDRHFVAGRIELERHLRPLGDRLDEVVTLDALLRETLEVLGEIERLRASALFLREDPHVGFQQVGSIGLPPRRRVNLIRNATWVEALEPAEPLVLEDLERTLESPRTEPPVRERTALLLRTMHDLDAQLVLPLVCDDRLLGFWTLSDVRTREPFSSSEIALLREVADRIALTIKNSRTFERVRARDRLVSLGEMAAGLAHEIRNPLATIRGAIEVLDSPSGPRMQQVMVEEIDRLDRVVGTFLDYAKPEAPVTGSIRDLGGFVGGCVEAACRTPARGDTAVTVDLEPDLPPVAATRNQLERVLTNVVQNALEALEGSGTLQVSVRLREGPPVANGSDTAGADDPGPSRAETVEILVEDDGPGMQDETLERAFVPFFSTKAAGTGLGLALCERFMRSQGGRIALDSTPGEGTRVRIELALAGEVDGETES